MKTPSASRESRYALLFQPGEFSRKYELFQLLEIQKIGHGINYALEEVNRAVLRSHFSTLPSEAHTLLLQFHPDYLAVADREIEQRYKKQKAGLAFPQFRKQSILRLLHQQFIGLKPWLEQLKCYHKTINPVSRNIQTQPCRFSEEKPQLRFEVTKAKEQYSLNTFVMTGDETFPLTDFIRSSFFLQKDNFYYLLSFADFQTLEWLSENLWNDSGLEQKEFVERVLSRIGKGYLVNRECMPSDKMINVVPECRVLLSELNGAFLLLTPQWLYGGLTVDGPWQVNQEMTINGERWIIHRHQETEERFLQLLSSYHPNFANQRNGYFYLSFGEAQKKHWFIKTYYNLLEQNVEVAGMDLLQHFRYSPHQVETTFTVNDETKAGLMNISMKVNFGKESVSLTTLQKALYAGQKAIVLKDGSLGVLSEAWMEKYSVLVKHGNITGGQMHVSSFLHLGIGENQQIPGSRRIAMDWRQRWHQWQNNEGPLFKIPDIVKAQLRPYQRKGFEWLALLSEVGAGACLADDMGLGKTLQTISFIAWHHTKHPTQTHLIVCPTSLLYNWQDEFSKFAPGLHVTVFYGSTAEKETEHTSVLITTYGTLRSQSERLLTMNFGIAVIDESHNIKNPAAQITRAVSQINAGIRIALSGTPVVNNTFDLYSQLSFAIPGLFGSREFFKREYADPIDRLGDETKIRALQKLTAPFILRRTKEQVVHDLPAKSEAILWCTMSGAQEELYNEIKEQIRSNLFLDIKNKGLGKTRLAVLQGLMKLRQICNHPALLPAEEHMGRLESTKTDMLFYELTNILGRHRVLIFSQFSSMLSLLSSQCTAKEIKHFLLDGQTPADRRMQMVREFQENTEAPHLFLISLKAGNTGLTLTAADYVFLFDPWWNTAVEQQAIDRTHRIGQNKKVFSYKLICKNTIEEKILDLQRRKKQLAEELITAEEDLVKSLTEEDIAYLFA